MRTGSILLWKIHSRGFPHSRTFSKVEDYLVPSSINKKHALSPWKGGIRGAEIECGDFEEGSGEASQSGESTVARQAHLLSLPQAAHLQDNGAEVQSSA